MTANISQLCGLIADPQEPLALRLSSNLMIGVARQAFTPVSRCVFPTHGILLLRSVYKGHLTYLTVNVFIDLYITVKQEILLTDVTTCFNTLKRAFQDAYVASSAVAQLQMAQPSVRCAYSHESFVTGNI
jgi:meiotic recombination protein REC8, fungi type